MSDNGVLIAFDGPDGVGKTTQLEIAATELRSQGYRIYTTHLFGGTPIGDALRQVIFSNIPRPALANLHICLAIYYALAAEIEVKREEGYTILLDRSPLSIIAYQVYGDGLDAATGFLASDDTMRAFRPDSVILYEAPADVLHARRSSRQKTNDYFEQQLMMYHERTIEGYRQAAQHYDVSLIDASRNLDQVHEATMHVIKQVLEKAALQR